MAETFLAVAQYVSLITQNGITHTLSTTSSILPATTSILISNPETDIFKHEITNSDHAITKSSRQTSPKSLSHHFILKTITGYQSMLDRMVELRFLPPKGGLFERPRAAFYTMETAGVMRRMTVVMAATTRRKTCFPTGGTAITAKAKPPTATTAFCVCPISHIKSAKRHHQPTHPPQTNAEGGCPRPIILHIRLQHNDIAAFLL